MRNYKYLLFIIIILSLVPIFGFGERKTEEKDLLMEFLEDMEAEFVEGDIDIGGTIIDEFISREELLIIGDRIRTELGIMGYKNLDEYYFEELIEEDGFVQLIVQGVDEEQNLISFTLSSYEISEGKAGETSLFVNLIKRVQFVGINDIILRIENIFSEYNRPINITTCVIGTIDESIPLEEIEKSILKTTKSIKGKVIEKYEESGILSLSIFTPYIEEYIYTGNNKMNLNIGIRFNEYEGKTYIWIGTPIIAIGY